MRESKQEPTHQQSSHLKPKATESTIGFSHQPETNLALEQRIQRLGQSGLHRAIAPHSSPNPNLLLHLQRQHGNRYVQRRVELSCQSAGEADVAAPDVETGIEQARGTGQPLDRTVQRQMESAFGTDFSRVRVHTDSNADTLNLALSARAFTTGQDIFFRQGEYHPDSFRGKELLAHELTHVVQQTGGIQAKLAIGQPNDRAEQEADQIAGLVMKRLSSEPPEPTNAQFEQSRSGSETSSLANSANSFAAFVQRDLMGEEEQAAKVEQATQTERPQDEYPLIQTKRSAQISRKCSTCEQRQYGNRYVQRLIVQSSSQREPAIQRVVEVRPPGRGEASAFERRQELIDRLNRQSSAMRYSLADRVLQYEVLDAAALTNFDRQMQGFIDRAEVVPMRLINRSGLVDGQSLLIDSLQLAYVDLDDMLASDDLSFQLNLIHFLVERFRVRNYERRIGTDMSAAFPRAHQAGIDAETEHLRSVIGDPTIRFNHEREDNGRTVFVFRSQEGYQVVHVFGRDRAGVRGGQVFVRTRDNRRLTIDQLRAERAGGTTDSGITSPDRFRFQLQPPSLLQPPNPTTQPQLGDDLQLHLDPAIAAMIAAQQLRQRLSQPNLQTALSAIVLPLPIPSSPTVPNPFSLPLLPQTPPPAPQAGPSSPRPGTLGDVLGAVIGLPQVRPLIDQAQARATQAAESAWQGIPPIGQRIIIGSGIGLSVGGLTWILADPNVRASLSQLSTPLNDRVIPIPGLSGFGLEVNTGNGNLTLGIHLDLGQLLPPFLGFGAGSFNPLGAPPQPQPLTLPGQ